MMIYRIYLFSLPLLRPYLEDDVRLFTLVENVERWTEQGVILLFEDRENLLDSLMHLIHYSRSIRHLVLVLGMGKKFEDFQTDPVLHDLSFGDFQFGFSCLCPAFDPFSSEEYFGNLLKGLGLIVEPRTSKRTIPLYLLPLDAGYVLGVDLVGFPLTRRDSRVHASDESLPEEVAIAACYEMDLHRKSYERVLDPRAGYGELIGEAARFSPRIGLHTKSRHYFPLYRLFNAKPRMPGESIAMEEHRYQGVVQDNRTFKYLRENLTYDGLKLKTSLISLDWLDVKFDENSVDMVMTYVPKSAQEEIPMLLYQLEFLSRDILFIISEVSFDLSSYGNYALRPISRTYVDHEGKRYWWQVFRKT